MRSTDYSRICRQHLSPRMKEVGFEPVDLGRISSYEVLYRKGSVWLGSDWEASERCLSVCFGKLYWFNDIVPRVTIVGDYSRYSNDIQKISDRVGSKSTLSKSPSPLPIPLRWHSTNFNGSTLPYCPKNWDQERYLLAQVPFETNFRKPILLSTASK